MYCKQHSQNGYNLLYPLVIVMKLITFSGHHSHPDEKHISANEYFKIKYTQTLQQKNGINGRVNH